VKSVSLRFSSSTSGGSCGVHIESHPNLDSHPSLLESRLKHANTITNLLRTIYSRTCNPITNSFDPTGGMALKDALRMGLSQMKIIHA